MKKIVVASVAGGLIVFVWSAIAHMATPLGTAGMSVLPDEARVLEALKTLDPRSGLYFFPGMDMSRTLTPEEQQAWEAKLRSGPVGLLVINTQGAEAFSPRQLAIELASAILAAGVAAYLLSLVGAPYLTRVVAVALLAVFASLSISASYWNWYGFPTAFVAGELVTELIGWLLAGLAIAWLVPAPAPLDRLGAP
jgi:hypothetical protein